MNLCEKSGVPINKDGRFCSLRMTMFFAEVKKDLFRRRKKPEFRAKRDKNAKRVKKAGLIDVQDKNSEKSGSPHESHPSLLTLAESEPLVLKP
jgi:hypothetical protein